MTENELDEYLKQLPFVSRFSKSFHGVLIHNCGNYITEIVDSTLYSVPHLTVMGCSIITLDKDLKQTSSFFDYNKIPIRNTKMIKTELERLTAEIKNMILDCDSNLRISYFFEDNLLWYSKFYFGEINIKTEKVEFWRIYFDEINKKGFKTLDAEVQFNEITPAIVKEQIKSYIESLEYTNKRIKEMEVMKRIADAGKDFI